MRIGAYAACLALLALCGSNCHAQSDGPSGLPSERHQIKDSLGRAVSYYVGHPKTRAPLLLMVQGSGCVPVMHFGSNPDETYSTLFDFLPFAKEGQFTVLAVEKPFSGMVGNDKPGTAVSCSPAFNTDFTAERWSVALLAALNDARNLPWVDRSRTLVIGESEGGVMAAMLAGRDNQISDVALIGASGTTQLFDFVALAYRRCADVFPCLSQIEAQAAAIEADPTSSTLFAWGHPYKRWSSFFRIDPTDELLRSDARVYLAFGTSDESVPPVSEEIAAAKLTVAHRDVTIHRVPNGSHNLTQTDNPSFRDMDKELRSILAWFWTKPTTTHRAVAVEPSQGK